MGVRQYSGPCIASAALIMVRDRHVPAPKPKFTAITTQDSENGVTEAALSPDGTNLAFATWRDLVLLRRISDGATRQLNTPPAFRIDRIAWFPDGKRLLVSGSPDGDQRPVIWEISTGTDPPRRILEDVADNPVTGWSAHRRHQRRWNGYLGN